MALNLVGKLFFAEESPGSGKVSRSSCSRKSLISKNLRSLLFMGLARPGRTFLEGREKGARKGGDGCRAGGDGNTAKGKQ